MIVRKVGLPSIRKPHANAAHIARPSHHHITTIAGRRYTYTVCTTRQHRQRSGPPSFASCWRAREAGLRENQNPAMEMVVNMHGLGAGGLLIEQGDPVMVSVSKRESRLGLALWPELPERAVIHLVRPGSAAAEAGLCCFDELLSINSEPCESAAQAVRKIRDAPLGEMRLRVCSCPVRLLDAAATIQRAWVRALFEQRGLVRTRLSKPEQSSRLGLTFSAEFPLHALVSAVAPDGLACGALGAGDLLVYVGGLRAASPSEAARQLRELCGEVTLLVVPARRVDLA